ncbi:acetolactate synthase [Coprinellus micaceus]|uniref:Acetolactate synthase n=2 Tax=Coprinellus micaceus TaxID=71717 RepID=A0A4Y7TZW4_COPMI|nr:acetolactate synthase [Coprinellus micaceus]
MAAPASKVHTTSRHAAHKLSAFARSKHTAAAAASSSSSSIVEAKLRVREHARNISRSTVSNATAAPAAFKPAVAGVRLPNVHNDLEGPHAAPDAALDHTFVGLTGGQIFHEMMLRHGVKHIFGYPGGAILPVFDAIYKSPHFEAQATWPEGLRQGIRACLVSSFVTSGPGATNVITPMQDALSGRHPPHRLHRPGREPQPSGSDAFQEADVVGISRSCTKWNVMVKDISELPRRINEAFKIATSGRPGPVLVDLPKDVTAGILKHALPFKATTPGINLGLPNAFLQSKQAARLINQAQRPVIYAGNGVLSSPMGPKFLKELAEQGNIPVCTTLQGLGAFDETSDKSAAHARDARERLREYGDAEGRRDHRAWGPPRAMAVGGIIHFEIQPKNINKVVEAQIPILGDVVANLSALVPHVKATPRKEWFETIKEWKEKYPFTYVKSGKGEKMKPQEVVEELDRQTRERKDETIIATGVGQHQMWAAQHYRWKQPRSMVTSGGLGTMGFGLPAAIGAERSPDPKKIVVDIDGDASFSMTAMELATAAQYDIGVKVLILNNEFQGMTSSTKNATPTPKMTNPDFVRLAQAMGVHAIRCHNAEELPAKMKEFLEYDNGKPVVMECVVEKDEHVFPMVPAGKALHEQLLHPKLRKRYESEELGGKA